MITAGIILILLLIDLKEVWRGRPLIGVALGVTSFLEKPNVESDKRS